MSVETKEIDRGMKAFLKQLRILDNKPYVKVGYPKDETHKDSDQSILIIASSNEFGTSDGRIPERSFMRSTAVRVAKKIAAEMTDGLEKITKQKTTVEKVLNRVGLIVQGETQKTITEIDSPPNAESTIKGKGSSSPLINTGFMRQSVKYEVNLKGGK